MDSEEKIFYQDANVSVTQSRYVVGGKTHAISNISSVSIHKVPNNNRTLAILMMVFGPLTIPSLGIAWGIGISIAGILYLYFFKREYAVRISTNSGESNSLISKDLQFTRIIVDALNNAIVHRG